MKHSLTRGLLLALALVFAVLSVVMGWRTWQWVQTDALTLPHRMAIQRWAEGQEAWAPAQWEQARADLLQAATISPQDPTVHDLLGALYAVRGNQVWWQEEERRQWYEQARQAHLRSAALRPTVPGVWFNLAMDTYATDRPRHEVVSHWRRALAAGPHEPSTRWGLVGLALAMWADAPTDMRRWVVLQQQSPVAPDRERLLGIAEHYGVALDH